MIASRAFPPQAYRACLGLLRLSERFSPERLEKACIIALSAGATRYQQVESILKKKLDTIPHSHDQSEPLISDHENIRGSNYYK
jgi:hypothetical protein